MTKVGVAKGDFALAFNTHFADFTPINVKINHTYTYIL